MNPKSDFINSNSVSPDDFKILIINLRNDSDPKIKASVSRKLSETLLKPHGFEAYFDYISSISDNSIESINIFSKIVFNRPSFFDDDSEYLNQSKYNFTCIIKKFVNIEDDQVFFTFMTNLFYFMRRSHFENGFGFFLEPIFSSFDESDMIIFSKLCLFNFYHDELCEFYSRFLKQYIILFVHSDCPSEALKSCIFNGVNTIRFLSLVDIFEGFDLLSVEKVLCLWLNQDIIPPKNIVEVSLLSSFPSTDFLEILEKYYTKFYFSSEFIYFLNQKFSKCAFDSNRWSNLITNNISNETSSPTNNGSSTTIDIPANLKSNSPTDIAFGLFEIRKLLKINSNNILDSEIINLLICCLFHEESYVYANAIKTCISVGKVSPSLICEPLLVKAESELDKIFLDLMIRFIEIFDGLLLIWKNNSCLAPFTNKFCLICSKYIQNSSVELNFYIFNYFTDILTYDQDSFLLHQEKVLSYPNLVSLKVLYDSDLLTEVFFKFIDNFLNVICDKKLQKSKPIVLDELYQFLKNEITSSLPHVAVMANHNLILLESIKNKS